MELLTIPQFCDKNAAFSKGGLRSLIFYKGQEAEKAGAIVRVGRRVLISEGEFLAWIKSGGARKIR